MSTARLLVTRLAPQGLRLVNALNAQGIFAHAQPLLTVTETAASKDVDAVLAKNYDFIIAVSGNAVDYTEQALLANNWPTTRYLAVGNGTQSKLQHATGQTVIVPDLGFDSEGLLALPCLQYLQGVRILILRGVGGRELLENTLTARGALVDYYEPYQRIAVQLNGLSLVKQWQQQGINGAIISSVELLQRLVEIVPEAQQSWLKKVTIYAPSERILKHAMSLGWASLKLLPSLVDEEIVAYFNEIK